jgi:hypothetical protein
MFRLIGNSGGRALILAGLLSSASYGWHHCYPQKIAARHEIGKLKPLLDKLIEVLEEYDRKLEEVTGAMDKTTIANYRQALTTGEGIQLLQKLKSEMGDLAKIEAQIARMRVNALKASTYRLQFYMSRDTAEEIKKLKSPGNAENGGAQ